MVIEIFDNGKSQDVRLIDIWLLGPFMVYLAFRKSLTKPQKVVLGLSGLATIWYNGRNYLKIKNE